MSVRSPTATTAPLLPLASSMSALLERLIHQPFVESASRPKPEERATTDRSDALCALMKVLQDQAAHDGYRLVTINAEAKRCILACSRQGGRPAATSAGASPAGVSSASPTSSATSPASPMSPAFPMSPSTDSDGEAAVARRATSKRCGCRCRINLNYHSKFNAWRVTSYEAAHNHSLHAVASSSSSTSTEEEYPQLTSAMIEMAIERYAAMNAPPEHSAILALANMRAMAMSGGTVNEQQQQPAPMTIVTAPTTNGVIGEAVTPSSPSTSSSSSSSNSADEERLLRRNLLARRLSTILNTPVTMNMSKPGSPLTSRRRFAFKSPAAGSTMGQEHVMNLQQQTMRSAPSPAMSDTSLNSLRGMTTSAIELDRYAMLHHQFKALIATACKRREWTESVLTGIGRFMDQLQAPQAATAFGPAQVQSGSMTKTPVVQSTVHVQPMTPAPVQSLVPVESHMPVQSTAPAIVPSTPAVPSTATVSTDPVTTMPAVPPPSPTHTIPKTSTLPLDFKFAVKHARSDVVDNKDGMDHSGSDMNKRIRMDALMLAVPRVRASSVQM